MSLRRHGQSGAILLFTFGILLTLTVLAGTFLFSVAAQTLGSGGNLTSAQALWAAEAGLQQVYYQLYSDAAFRSTPTTPVAGAIGAGTYSVTVVKAGSTYTLTSTGTVNSFNRVIARTVTAASDWADAFDYAVYGDTNGSQLRLRNTVTITGGLFYDGAVRVDADASVTGGSIYSDSITGTGTYTWAGGLPAPVPAFPSFDTATYDAAIAIADPLTADLTLTGSSNLNLAGGIVYYDDVTIRDNATVTGPGTIVSGDDATIEENANIGANVTIIAKDVLLVQDAAIVQSGGVLYSRSNVNLRDDVQVTGSLLSDSGQVSLRNDVIFSGIIYADVADFQDNADITGSIVADDFQGGDINNGVQISFSAAARPSTVPAGLTAGATIVTPQADWEES